MSVESALAPAVVPHDQVRVLRAFGEEIRIHLSGKETGGSLSQWEIVTPPGGGPPPHYHTREDEAFWVLEGRVAFLVDGAWQEVGPGAGAYLPRNSVHTFKNVGETPSRMMATSTPSGFEDFFATAAEEFAKPEGPNIPKIMKIAAEHGIHFVEPSPAE